MARRWIPSRQAIVGTLLFAGFLAAIGFAVHSAVWPAAHAPARVSAQGRAARIGDAARRDPRMVPARTTVIAGRVIDDAEQPTPRVADVTLAEWSDTDVLTPVQTVRTDGAGEFRFDEVPPGRYRVSASGDGWVSRRAGVGFTVGDADAHHVIVVVAAGGRTLAGTIHDRTGGVVAGASVAWQVVGAPEAGVFATIADAAGAYSLAIPRQPGTLVASADGYADESVAVDGLDTSTDLALWPGATVLGVVVDGDGAPVGDALVYAGPPSGAMRRIGSGDASALVDGGGRFELEAVRPGTVELHAVGPTGVSASVEIAAPAGGSVGPIRLALDGGVTLRGRVVSHDRLHGLAGFDVTCQAAGATIAAPAPSDDDGAFAIYGVTVDACQLVVGAPSVALAATRALAIDGADVEDIELPVALGRGLSGRVEPPGSARVELVQADDALAGGGIAAIRPSHTDERGHFSFAHTPVGAFDVRAIADDGRIGRVALDGPAEEVVVELAASWVVAGRVVQDGERPQGALRVVARGASGRATVTTAADGTFTLRGADAGTLTVTVTDDGGHPLRLIGADGERVSFVSYTPVDGATLELTAEPRDGRIDGVVVADGGERVADARVIAVPDRIPVAERMGLAPASTECASARPPAAGDAVVTTSDDDGAFRFDGLRRDLVYAVYVEPTDRPGSGCVGRVRTGARLAVELGTG